MILSENLELNLEEIEMEDNEDEINNDLDIEFEGEVMDLDAVSRKDIEPLYLHENYEIPKLTDEVFEKEVRVNDSYTPFLKRHAK